MSAANPAHSNPPPVAPVRADDRAPANSAHNMLTSVPWPLGRGATLAEHYVEAGLTPFAVSAKTKIPSATGWQTVEVTTARAQFCAWPNAMVGLNTERHGLVVVDLDNKDGKAGSINFRELCAQNYVSLAGLPSVRTPSGGEHFYFRARCGAPVKSTVEKLGSGIDTRGKGGYVVAPGSVRRDGGEYQPVSPADLGDFIKLIADPASLPEFPAVLAALVGLAPPREAQGEQWGRPENFPVPTPVVRAAAVREGRQRLARFERAALVLACAGQTVNHEDWRNRVLFALMDFALDWPELEGEACDIYMQICAEGGRAGANTSKDEDAWAKALGAERRPPGQARTLEHTVADAVALGLTDWQGYLLPELVPTLEAAPLSSMNVPAQAPTGHPQSCTTEQPALQGRPAVSPARAPNAKAFGAQATSLPVSLTGHEVGPRISTAAELRSRTFAPVRWVVPGCVAEGCTLLAGKPKIGKSWMALEMGLAVATGGTCLGGVACEQGDVLYLALEDNERRLQGRIDKLLGMFAAEWPAAFAYATEWPRDNDGGLQRLNDWIIHSQKPRLVIVDVLAMFKSMRGSRESLYEADYLSVKGLQALAGKYGIAIVIVHHLRKAAAEGDPFEAISGTMGLSGAADTALILNRGGSGTTLYGRGRDVEEIEKAVAFDRTTCRWKIQGEASEVQRSGERNAVLTALREVGSAMSPAEIAGVTGAKLNATYQLLHKMTCAGEVIKDGRGRYLAAKISLASP